MLTLLTEGMVNIARNAHDAHLPPMYIVYDVVPYENIMLKAIQSSILTLVIIATSFHFRVHLLVNFLPFSNHL
jgi:hypothetical protein